MGGRGAALTGPMARGRGPDAERRPRRRLELQELRAGANLLKHPGAETKNRPIGKIGGGTRRSILQNLDSTSAPERKLAPFYTYTTAIDLSAPSPQWNTAGSPSIPTTKPSAYPAHEPTQRSCCEGIIFLIEFLERHQPMSGTLLIDTPQINSARQGASTSSASLR